MNRPLLLLLLASAFNTSYGQFTLLESGTDSHINSIRYSDGRLYFLGHRYLAKSDDLGETIQTLNVPDELPFTYSLKVMDTSTFYLVSAHHFPVLQYNIMKTVDGATTWDTLFSTQGTTINGIDVSEGGRIMAVGNFGHIYRSHDQMEWTVHQIGMMTVPTRCRSVNDTTFLIGAFERYGVSNTFGATWHTGYLEKCYPNDFSLFGEDTIYFTSHFHNWYKSYISRSYDGGYSWSTIPIADHIGIYGSYFLNKDHGFAVGYDHLNLIGVLLETQDAGNSWIRHELPYDSMLLNVTVVNDSVLFAAGYNGVIFRTDLAALPASISRIELDTFNIGPNPVGADQELWIRGPLEERGRLTIRDGLGRVIGGREFNGSTAITFNSPGSYHLEIMWKGGVHHRKIVVQ